MRAHTGRASPDPACRDRALPLSWGLGVLAAGWGPTVIMKAPSLPLPVLSFQASPRDTLHDLALQDEEDDQDGYACQDGGRHDLGVTDAERGLHRRQADRQRHHVIAGDYDKGPDEIVPGDDEGEDAYRGDGGSRQRHPYL